MCPATSSHHPPECDRVNRRLSRSFTGPSCQISEDSTPVRASEVSSKSLAIKILRAPVVGSRTFSGRLVFSIFCGPEGGGGYAGAGRRRFGWRGCRTVAEGLRPDSPLYPAPRSTSCWAVMTRACGANSYGKSSHFDQAYGFYQACRLYRVYRGCRERPFVRGRKLRADLFPTQGGYVSPVSPSFSGMTLQPDRCRRRMEMDL